MLAFAQGVRTGSIRGSAGEPFRLVVNIGIGGSDLGPAMAVQALRAFTAGAPRCEFVSNVDGVHLAEVLESADPKTTLFIISSKTFTTLETQTNARSARAWLAQRLGEQAVPQHFGAVSVNHQAMDAFGVHPQYRFQMWDWVGGRYSIWSSIGVCACYRHRRAEFPRLPRRRSCGGRALPHRRMGRESAGADGAAGRVEHQLHGAADTRSAPLR